MQTFSVRRPAVCSPHGLVAAQNRHAAEAGAACATGEEPYSLAFYLSEHFPTTAGWDWRVQATDVSTKALAPVFSISIRF